jgi:pilus assembly protein CpaE
MSGAGQGVAALRTLQVLVVGGTPALSEELESALRAATEARVALRWAADFAEAGGAARVRPPDLVCTELGASNTALRAFVEELRALAPGVSLLGIRGSAQAEAGVESSVLVEALRAGFLDVLRRPVSSNDLRELVPRVLQAVRQREGEGVVVAFHSTKGGVGKSTLSVNVACGLARLRPDRVLLVDASLQLGVCAAALDLDAPTVADVAREQGRLDETMLRELACPHRSGVRLVAAPRDPVDAADVGIETLARLVAVARRAFDFVVLDTVPVIDGAMLTLLDFADRVYLVNQGTVPDVIGAVRLLETLDGIGIGAERRRIVLNRNLPRFAGSLTRRDVADRLGCPVDHEVPHDRRVLTAFNLGEPRVLRARGRWGWGRAIARVVDEVAAIAEAERATEARRADASARSLAWRPAQVDA